MNSKEIADARETKTMTTSELAEQLRTTNDVILRNARKALPDKVIKNGKTTYWNVLEITRVIEEMKKGNSNQHSTFVGATKAETKQTLAVQIAKHSKALQELYEKALQEQARIIEEQAGTIKLIADNSAERQYKQTLRTECTELIRRLLKETGLPFVPLWREAYEGFLKRHNFNDAFKSNFYAARNKIDFLARKDINYLKDLKQAIVSLFANEERV